MKKYFDTLKEAKEAQAKSMVHLRIYKVKQGRRKGQYFVGTQLEWFSV